MAQAVYSVDLRGINSPLLIMSVMVKVDMLRVGDLIRVSATDPWCEYEVDTFCHQTGNSLVKFKEERNGTFVIDIRKNTGTRKPNIASEAPLNLSEFFKDEHPGLYA